MLPKTLRALTLIFLAGLAAAMTLSCAGTEKKEAMAHYKIGASHLNTGNVQMAFIEFQKALELDPGSKEIHNALGIVHLKLEDLRSAERSFKKAASIDSGYSEAHNNLCFVYYGMERYEDAIKSCQRSLKNTLYTTPEKAFYNLGLSYYRLGLYDEAIRAFTDAVLRQPFLYPAHYGLAIAFNAKKLYGDAAASMMRAVEIDPRFKGDRKKAEEEFSRTKSGLELKDNRDYIEILRY